MRINQFVAAATGLSRRAADHAIQEGRVRFNGQPPALGQSVEDGDRLTLDGRPLKLPSEVRTIMLNKPPGYVCSRDGQGSSTIYQLLPPEMHTLKAVGRLDKYSSGLLLMTTDGQLAHRLSHPSNQKQKIYQVELNQPLAPPDKQRIAAGVKLEDGPSHLAIHGNSTRWQVAMYEGRNRQIRRTFEALGYRVVKLHRSEFGPYKLGNLKLGDFRNV